MSYTMLNENEIIDVLVQYLRLKGLRIIQAKNTGETGIDIIAEGERVRYFIEAKGETSSKTWTNRFGLPFSRSQVQTHIAEAILASFKVLNDKPAGARTKVGIAVPNTDLHKEVIDQVYKPLKTIGIKIYLVGDKEIEER